MPRYDEDEVRRRVEEEVNSLTEAELRMFRLRRDSMENWIYRTARAIGRILSAPFRWIAEAIRGLLDGLFGWLS